MYKGKLLGTIISTVGWDNRARPSIRNAQGRDGRAQLVSATSHALMVGLDYRLFTHFEWSGWLIDMIIVKIIELK
jgi:hypothetical protein